MRLYIIRHGEPNYQLDCLTETGKKQAALVAERFKNVKIDAIYASTQGRAWETASYTARLHNMDIIPAAWAREDDGGQFFYSNGNWFFYHQEWADLFKSEEVLRLGHDWFNHPKIKETRMAEGYRFMEKACDQFLLELGIKHDRASHLYQKVGNMPENVFLFAHGAFCVSFLSSLLDIPYPIFTTTHHHFGFTGVVTLDFVESLQMFQIISYGDISHLDKLKEIDNQKMEM